MYNNLSFKDLLQDLMNCFVWISWILISYWYHSWCYKNSHSHFVIILEASCFTDSCFYLWQLNFSTKVSDIINPNRQNENMLADLVTKHIENREAQYIFYQLYQHHIFPWEKPHSISLSFCMGQVEYLYHDNQFTALPRSHKANWWKQ